MVRLDRITMQGFKSFANRITIPFPSGFNTICGPNGSGKSNVIDGLLFVLGTTARETRSPPTSARCPFILTTATTRYQARKRR